MTYATRSALIVALVGAIPVGAEASPEGEFAGQIVILKKRAPPHFPTAAAFSKFLRSNRIEDVWTTTKESSTWKLEFMAFFNRPIADVDIKVRFFDVTAAKKLAAADSIFTSARGQRILASSFTLEQPEFEIDHKYVMVLSSGRGAGREAITRFTLRGRHEKYDDKVVFEEAETRSK